MTSAIVYQCNVCNRTIQLPVNKQGLEVVGGCIITNNCKGQLFVTGQRDNVLQIPVPVPSTTGLKDWEQRRLLYTHTQAIAVNQWRIVHNLGTNPAIQVYVIIDQILTEIIPTSITYISPFQATVSFDQGFVGVAQCIARSTSTITSVNIAPVVTPLTYTQITTKGTLTLVSTTHISSVLDMQFFDPNTLDPLGPPISTPYTLGGARSFLSPWYISNNVVIKSIPFYVATIDILGLISINNIPPHASFWFINPYPGDYIIFGVPPYTNLDKNVNQALLMTDLTNVDNSFSYQVDGDLLVNSALLRKIYPPIFQPSQDAPM